MKKLTLFSILFLTFALLLPDICLAESKYTKSLSASEVKSICEKIKKTEQKSSTDKNILQNSEIIPASLTNALNQTVRKLSDSTAYIMILGKSLMCHSEYARWDIVIPGFIDVVIVNIPIWITGFVIYFFGFMITLGITYYLVDISFKIGFAVIILPVAIALWPFKATADKLPMVISVFLKNAAIFGFLATSVSYAMNLLLEAVKRAHIGDALASIEDGNTDLLAELFSVTGSSFLIILFALAYGLKMIGNTIEDYVNTFFPDSIFGSESPMHGKLTQATDFAKSRLTDGYAARWVKAAAHNKGGEAMSKLGQKVGQTSELISKAADKAGEHSKLGKVGLKIVSRTVGVQGRLLGNIGNDMKEKAKEYKNKKVKSWSDIEAEKEQKKREEAEAAEYAD